MIKSYKKIFWLTFAVLIFSNLFWIYQTINNALGHDYYKVSCDEYYKDAFNLRKVLESKSDIVGVIEFLENNKIEYESFQKGTDSVINLNSFDLIYNKKGELIESNVR